MLLDLLAKLWNRLAGPLRRELAWLAHSKFIHGVSGIIINENGRVLLLKHRFWKDQRWGLPGGLARRGEALAATLRRELREETGLDVQPSRLLQVRTSQDRLAEFVLLARCTGEPLAMSPEIIEARFWELSALPEDLLPSQREVLTAPFETWPGIPLEE
jgi:ADP-ribose pyrophosphatase YjhB (NUDIX family)